MRDFTNLTAKHKGAYQPVRCSAADLCLCFFFAYKKSWLSHEIAQRRLTLVMREPIFFYTHALMAEYFFRNLYKIGTFSGAQ